MPKIYYNGALSVLFASCLLAGVNCETDPDDILNHDYIENEVNQYSTSSTAENSIDIYPKTSQTNVYNSNRSGKSMRMESTPSSFPQV